MSNKIFRQVALDNLATPEELDKLLRVTDPRGWLALAAIIVLLGAALIWGIFGSIPDVLQAPGVLTRPGGLQSIQVDEAGQLSGLQIKDGSEVKEGQVVALLKLPSGSEIAVKSAYTGTVLEVLVANGTQIKPDTSLATLEVTNQPLEALVFVPLADRTRLRSGQKVQLNPTNVSASEFGFLEGTIINISPIPASVESVQASIQNRELATALVGNTPVFKVEVSLGSPGNLKWSSGKQPGVMLSSGTVCSASLILDQQSPIRLLLPGR